MKKTITVLATTALLLTGCAVGVDGFPDEQVKEEAWAAYNCDIISQRDGPAAATAINLDILQGNIPSDEVPEARRWADKLSNASTVGAVIDRTSTKTATNLCDGWLWERHTSDPDYWEGYDEFTWENAEAAGIIEGQ